MVVESKDPSVPNTIGEVVAALKRQKFAAKHDKQDWGDWINLEGLGTVISIESMRGLTTTATIELADDDPDDVFLRVQKAFAALDWQGVDEDGAFELG